MANVAREKDILGYSLLSSLSSTLSASCQNHATDVSNPFIRNQARHNHAINYYLSKFNCQAFTMCSGGFKGRVLNLPELWNNKI